MNIEELIDEIMEKAENDGVDLQSLGIFDADDLQTYALKFMLNHLDDLDEEIVEDSDYELDAILDDYPEISFVKGD